MPQRANRRSRWNRYACLWAVLLTLTGFAQPCAAARYFFEPAEAQLARAAEYPRWADLMVRHLSQRPTIESCLADAAGCPRALKGYREIVLRSRPLSPARKMMLVNRFVNMRHWRVEPRRDDEWHTLTEFLSGGGDCEDYAIAKYFALRRLGFTADDLRVGIVRDTDGHSYHAITIVRIDDQIHFLDVDGAPRRSTSGYRFLFSINENGIWDHAAPVPQAEEERL